jgi:hypothetical protein
VVLDRDVTTTTVWSCPLYTLSKPIFVLSNTETRTKLTIAPGTVIRGVAGDLDAQRLPGALIVSRTGILEAIGAPGFPIVFTSEKPAGERAPGDWGGVVLLGRAPTNVPDHLEPFANPVAGEIYIEGLPPSDAILYGARILSREPAAGGASGAGAGGAGAAGGGESGAGGEGGSSTASPFVNTGDPEWSCGTLKYVRIEFPGFKVAQSNELNGLTLGACGSGTVIDHVQIHKSSDDGIELFGGSVDLKHVVLTGVKDDALDWDQGYRGRMQFVAIQMHDDRSATAGAGDSGIEADGYAALDRTFDRPSNARIHNLTLIASATTLRGVRLREGTQLTMRNSLLLAAPNGATEGLIDLGDATTANFVTSGELLVENNLFHGPWPASGQADSAGTLYVEADYFLRDTGDRRNREAPSLDAVLPHALDEAHPGWVPPPSSLAAEGAGPIDPDPFFQEDASYLGAFEPGGVDWTEGWTAYPER